MPKIILLILLLLLASSTEAQEENHGANLQLGFSFPEMIHVGIGYYLNENTTVNFKIGTIPDDDYPLFNNLTFSGDLGIYFGEECEKRYVRRWSYNPGFSYVKDEINTKIWHYIFLNNSVSHDIFISNDFILQSEIGIILKLMGDVRKKPNYSSSWFSGLNVEAPSILPKVGLRSKYYFSGN